MNCPRCQAPLLPGAKFCTSCGLALDVAASQETTSPGSQAAIDAAPTAQIPPTPSPAAADPAFGQSYPSQPAQPPADTNVPPPAFPSSQPPAGYAPATTPPMYSPPPSQPFYTPQPQQGYAAPPSQPFYTPQPQQGYGSPLSQPMYQQQPTPPVVEAPYAPPQYATPQYAAPASTPLAPGQYVSPGSVPLTTPQYMAPGSTPMGAPQYATYATPRQPSQPFMPHIFGADADPNTAQASTRLQAYLLKNVPRQYAVSKWFGAVVGGLLAIVVGLLLSIPAQELWKKSVGVSALGGFNPLGSLGSGGASSNPLLSPGVFTFFTIENHVPLTYGISSSSLSSGSFSLTLPMIGLFIVPVISLILGGYVSAASDFSRRARFSVARGALIAPVYALCLVIVAVIGKHDQLGAQPLLAFLYGLLWGAVFGAIGGWIQQSGAGWLSALLGKLQSVGNGRIVGAVAGAVSALVSVVLLGTACAMGYFSFILTQAAGAGRSPDIGEILRMGVTYGPTSGLYLLGVANGASLDTYTNGAGQNQSTHTGILVNHHHPPNMWQFIIYGVALAASYIIGGRVAARVARAGRADQAFAAGAMMAIPLSLLMALAAWLTLTTAGTSGGGQSVTYGVGLSVGGMFITSLVAGAVLGGIGGASLFTLPALGGLARALLLPFRPIGLALNPLLDALTGAPRGQRRSKARAWIYDAVLVTVILGAVVIVLNVLGSTLASSLSYPLLRALYQFAGALLVGLPIMYLTGALFAELNSGPVAPALASAPQAAFAVAQPATVGAWPQQSQSIDQQPPFPTA